MKYKYWMFGLICALCANPAFGQDDPGEIQTWDESADADIADQNGEDWQNFEDPSWEDVLQDAPPESSSDYEEIYQMRTLERTLIPNDSQDQDFETTGSLPPANHLGLSHDAVMQVLLDSSSQSHNSRGLQRQGTQMMAAAMAIVRQQLSAPGTTIEQPFGLDCTAQPAVQEYIAIFTAPGSKTMKAWLKRMGKYKDVLEKALNQEGVPADLIYLAMIESGFKPRVKSPASAAGMWQFMAGTARDMGLKIDDYVDERFDPIKSAHAAAQYLKKQYARYNSWPLAMAAYNGGAGTVNVAIDRFNTNDYFKLVKYGAMYDETRRYVPRILAAAIIGKNLKAFGFDGLTADAPFVFDTVSVPPLTKLSRLAEAAGCTVDTLKDLNPELLKDSTPPGKDYELRIPLGKHKDFVEKFDKVSAKYKDSNDTMVLRYGETLETLSEDIGVPSRVLRNINALKSKEELPYGSEVFVPDGSKRGHHSKDTKHTDEDKPIVLISPEKFTFRDRTRIFYETQKGDTLGGIAAAFNLLPNQIANWNELDIWSNLRPKMFLQIFVSDTDILENIRYYNESDVRVVERGTEEHKEIIEAQKNASKSKSSSSSNGKTKTSSKYVIHVVGKGDTLSKIAQKYKVSLKSILDLNGIKEDTPIRKGQELKVKKK